jgi:hypothetical protein
MGKRGARRHASAAINHGRRPRFAGPLRFCFSIGPEKSVGPVLPRTGPPGASHKRVTTLIFRSLLIDTTLAIAANGVGVATIFIGTMDMLAQVNLWKCSGGLLFILSVFVDALWTTVMPKGAGPITSVVCRFALLLVLKAPHATRRRMRPMAGSISMLLTILAWVVLLWVGWWLLFSADPASVLHAQSGRVAGGWSRAYFTGFLIFTLGVGDYVPFGAGWQMAAAIASFSGLFLITLSITYLLTVLPAVTQKRQLAVMIHDLGSTPAEMVRNGWNGSNFDELIQRLTSAIWPMIQLHTQRHLTLPILHYFHSSEPGDTLPVNIAALDEALYIINYGVAPSARPRPWQLSPIRQALDRFLELLNDEYMSQHIELPPTPDLAFLDSLEIPKVPRQEFEANLSAEEARRRQLYGYVKETGWQWDHVISG